MVSLAFLCPGLKEGAGAPALTSPPQSSHIAAQALGAN